MSWDPQTVENSRAIQQLSEGLGRIEGKLDVLLETQTNDDTGARVRRLENQRAWLLGAATALGTVFSVFINEIKHFFQN